MNRAARQSTTGVLSEAQIGAYEKRYLAMLETGKEECPDIPAKYGDAKKGKMKRTRARNLLNRLINFTEDTLRFAKESNIGTVAD